MNEPTHFVNKISSCIDLIFSSDLNITRNCGIEETIHQKCHHDIIYGLYVLIMSRTRPVAVT